MMKRLILLLMMFFLMGCAVKIKPKHKLDTLDKTLLATAIGLQIADGFTTSIALDNPDNCELNTFYYGKHPSDERLIAIKILSIGVTVWVANELPPTPRKWVLGLFSVVYGGVTFSTLGQL